MRVLDGSIEEWGRLEGAATLTLGVFDGVHLGHRQLIERAFDHPGRKVVITFDPHPVEVLAPGTPPRLITTLPERLDLLADLGTEVVAVLDLAEIRHMSPDRFVDDVLIGNLNMGSLSIGSDFHFGKDRAGNVDFLRRSGSEHGFEVEVVELVQAGDGAVSSSQIRDLIADGSVDQASELLGSRYRMTNTVVDGDKRGRAIGFPTANLEPVRRKIIPANGVYATIATVRGASYPAATNVGIRPTFGGGRRLVEAYLLDYDENMYGEDLTIEFVSRLRPEVNFESVDDLIDQMGDDVDTTRRLLATVMG